jgi:pimeloyl-ACP methyl ester carboxylesterase
MFFFQHPLAEAVVAGNDLAFIDRLWADWSPGFDAGEDLALLKPSLRDPANLAAALGYYRAALSGVGVDPALDDLQAASQQMPTVPTLYLHGTTDGCIGPEVAALAATAAPPNVRIEHVDGVGHFLHREAPDMVNRRVVEFLTS